MIVFRVCDSRFPFLWTLSSGVRQRPARWHGDGEGPVQYFADSPPGAWSELLRHEEITDAADLAGISARLWVIQIDDVEMHEPDLPSSALGSSPDGYDRCRSEARRLRAAGATRIVAPSAALKPGEGAGFHVSNTGLQRAERRDGRIIAHFGALPNAEGWCAADYARPDAELSGQVRPLYPVRWLPYDTPEFRGASECDGVGSGLKRRIEYGRNVRLPTQCHHMDSCAQRSDFADDPGGDLYPGRHLPIAPGHALQGLQQSVRHVDPRH